MINSIKGSSMAITLTARFDADILRGLAIPAAILAAWETAAHFQWINVVLLSSPSAIARTFEVYIGNGELWDNLSVSLTRMVLGWLSGIGVGIVLGAVIGLVGLALDQLLRLSERYFLRWRRSAV